MTSFDRKEFLAPEVLQREGRRIDNKSHVWITVSFSFLIPSWSYRLHQAYLLLTGRSLFSDSYIASPVAVAKQTLQFGKLERLLTECGKIEERDICPTALFLRSCLEIKPTVRASAKEIMTGGWATSGWL
jgi:serine/threonine-protein kinase SRPK3